MTSKVIYTGDLRTESTHIASGATILSDAPVDNNGKGMAFSPTDTVANALGSCMLTVMAIKATEMGIELKNTTVGIEKIMGTAPRRIAQINATVTFSVVLDDKERQILENTARTCPVFHSLHPDIQKNILFISADAAQ